MRTEQRLYSYDVEVMPDGTVRVLRVDDALAQMWGYSLEELQQGAWKQLISGTGHPTSSLIEQCREGRSFTSRVRLNSRDGDERVYMVHREPELLSDRMIVRSVARDITEAARSHVQIEEREARLRLLAQQIPLTMWSTDKDLRVTWSSGGEPSRVDLSRELMVSDFFGEEGLSRALIDASKRALQGQTVTFDHEWEDRLFRFSIESHHDEVGDVSGTIGVAINLTDIGRGRPIPVASDLVGAVATSVQPLEEQDHPEAVVVGDIWIDADGYIVRKNGKEIALTITEFKLLLEFARKPGKVLTPLELTQKVWGTDFMASHSNIPMAIKRLRAKIEDDPSDPHVIETVRGIGYRMRNPGA